MTNKEQITAEELQKIQLSMTPDQWALCHLLYTVFLEILRERGAKEVDMHHIRDYMAKATSVVRDYVQQVELKKLIMDLLNANKSMNEALPKAFDGRSKKNMELWGVSAYMYKYLIMHSGEILAGKTFKECFPDIFFTKEGYVSSPKAVIIVHGVLAQIDKDQTNDSKAKGENSSSGKTTSEAKNEGGKSSKDKSSINDKSVTKSKSEPKDKIDSKANQKNKSKATSSDVIDPLTSKAPKTLELDIVEDVHPYIRNWEEIKNDFYRLPYEQTLLFHAISLYLCNKFLKWNFYSKYNKAVVKAFSTYEDNANPKQKLKTLLYANDAFAQLKEDVLDYIFNGHDFRAVALKNDLFTMATDICLEYMSAFITNEKALQLIKDVRVFKDAIAISHELESLAFTFYLAADEQYVQIYGKKIQDIFLGDDWTDYEEDDDKWYKQHYGYYDQEDEWDDEDEEWEEDDESEEDDKECEKELTEEQSEYVRLKAELEQIHKDYMEKTTSVVKDLNTEQDILAHAVIQNIMSQYLKPRIYSKYLRAARKLFETFNSETSPEETALAEARRNADDLLLKRHEFTYKDADYDVHKGRIDDFRLVSSASRICLKAISHMGKEEVDQLLNSLTFNRLTKEYIGSEIGKLSSKFIGEAREFILSHND